MPAPPFGEAAALTTELTWLEVVAIHEAYRLSGIERRELHLEDLAIEGDWDTILAGRVTVEDQLERSKPCALLRPSPTVNVKTCRCEWAASATARSPP